MQAMETIMAVRPAGLGWYLVMEGLVDVISITPVQSWSVGQ